MTRHGLISLVAALLVVGLVPALPWAAAWPWIVGVVALWSLVTFVATVSPRSGLFGPVVTAGDGDRPWVALTWDDGPDPRVTPALLDLLAERDVQGAFFLIGERAAAQPELLERLRAEGHLLGNHSWAHAPCTNALTTARQVEQMQRTQRLLAGDGEPPRHYRPPFGLLSHSVLPACRQVGLTPVCWTLRSWDTRPGDPRRVVERVLRGARPGSIVLLHDGGRDPDAVLAIARGVLDGLAERGLQPVRLDRLLQAG